MIKQGRTSTAEKSNLGAVLHKCPLQAQIRAVSPWYWPILHRSWKSGTGASMQRLQYQKEKLSAALGTIYILRKLTFRIFRPPLFPTYVSMSLILKISNNWHFLTPSPTS